jgi:hypothetical protein
MKMKWIATVQRTATQETTFQVEGDTQEEATLNAQAQAGDKDFRGTEKDAEYAVVGLRAVLVSKDYKKD